MFRCADTKEHSGQVEPRQKLDPTLNCYLELKFHKKIRRKLKPSLLNRWQVMKLEVWKEEPGSIKEQMLGRTACGGILQVIMLDKGRV